MKKKKLKRKIVKLRDELMTLQVRVKKLEGDSFFMTYQNNQRAIEIEPFGLELAKKLAKEFTHDPYAPVCKSRERIMEEARKKLR